MAEQAGRIADFVSAVNDLPWVAERLAAGQQFNVYESVDNDDDDDPDDLSYAVCIGPITDHRLICLVVGRRRARILETALKAATAISIQHLLSREKQ